MVDRFDPSVLVVFTERFALSVFATFVVVERSELSFAVEPLLAAMVPALDELRFELSLLLDRFELSVLVVVFWLPFIDLLLPASLSATSPTAVLPPVAADLPPLTELLF